MALLCRTNTQQKKTFHYSRHYSTVDALADRLAEKNPFARRHLLFVLKSSKWENFSQEHSVIDLMNSPKFCTSSIVSKTRISILFIIMAHHASAWEEFNLRFQLNVQKFCLGKLFIDSVNFCPFIMGEITRWFAPQKRGTDTNSNW